MLITVFSKGLCLCPPCTCFRYTATCAGQKVYSLPPNIYLLDISRINIFDTLIRNIYQLKSLKNLQEIHAERNIYLNCSHIIKISRESDVNLSGDCTLSKSQSLRQLTTTAIRQGIHSKSALLLTTSGQRGNWSSAQAQTSVSPSRGYFNLTVTEVPDLGIKSSNLLGITVGVLVGAVCIIIVGVTTILIRKRLNKITQEEETNSNIIYLKDITAVRNPAFDESVL